VIESCKQLVIFHLVLAIFILCLLVGILTFREYLLDTKNASKLPRRLYGWVLWTAFTTVGAYVFQRAIQKLACGVESPISFGLMVSWMLTGGIYGMYTLSRSEHPVKAVVAGKECLSAEEKVLERIGWRPCSIDMPPMHTLWAEVVRLQNQLDEIRVHCENALPAKTIAQIFHEPEHQCRAMRLLPR